MKIKNKKEINQLRQEFETINPELDLDNFSSRFMFYAIDEQITKLKEKQKAIDTWFKVIKPQKLQSLKSELDYINDQIGREKSQLEGERESMERADINRLRNTSDPSEIIFYDNTKKWVTLSLKNLATLYKRFQKVNSDIISLESDNSLYVVDDTGKLSAKSDDSELIMISIRHHIKANLEIEISKERLSRLLIGDDNESEADDDF
ncbi:hypothetical protein NXS15_01155 [Mycoplasma sp. CSL7475-4]|nr:hypothetical protein [Mycoplasma sp. CSL7475-4]